jgi:hypothetical protein
VVGELSAVGSLPLEDFERISERERQLRRADHVKGESEEVGREAWDEMHRGAVPDSEIE